MGINRFLFHPPAGLGLFLNKCERMNFRCAKSKNNDHRVRYGAFPRAAKMLFDRTVSKTKFCVWTNISVQSAAVKWKQDSSRVEALIIQKRDDWVAGAPEKSLWFGTKVRSKKFPDRLVSLPKLR